MKKVFFPLLAIASLTAMSFTSVKAEQPIQVQEVSMEDLYESVDGSKWVQESIYKDVIQKNVYVTDQVMAESSKMEDVLSKY